MKRCTVMIASPAAGVRRAIRYLAPSDMPRARITSWARTWLNCAVLSGPSWSLGMRLARKAAVVTAAAEKIGRASCRERGVDLDGEGIRSKKKDEALGERAEVV